MFLINESFNILFQALPLGSLPIASKGFQDPLENVHLDVNGLPILYFKTKVIYFYSRDSRSWCKMDSTFFELGLLQDMKGKENMAVCSVN